MHTEAILTERTHEESSQFSNFMKTTKVLSKSQVRAPVLGDSRPAHPMTATISLTQDMHDHSHTLGPDTQSEFFETIKSRDQDRRKAAAS